MPGWKERAQPVQSASGGGGGGWKSRAVSATSAPAAQEETPVADFGKSMIMGSSIAENFPGGKTLADIGSKIGSGISAATMAPFSDKSMGELYDEGQGAMAKANDERAAIDAKSPMAVGTKEVLAGIAPLALKRGPMAAATEAEEMSTPGQFNYPGDSRLEKMKSYLSPKMTSGEKAPSSGVMSTVLKEGEEMLPYWARKSLQLGRKFKGGAE